MEYAWMEVLTIGGTVVFAFYLVYALYYNEYKDFFE